MEPLGLDIFVFRPNQGVDVVGQYPRLRVAVEHGQFARSHGTAQPAHADVRTPRGLGEGLDHPTVTVGTAAGGIGL